MHFFRMELTPTDMAASGIVDGRRIYNLAKDTASADGDQAFTNIARCYLNDKFSTDEGYLPAQESDSTGKHQHDDSREMQGLRQGLEESSSRPGIRKQQLRDEGGQEEEEAAEGHGGIRGVQGVPQMAEGLKSARVRFGQLGIDPEEIQQLIKPVSGRRARHVKRVVNQAKSALKTAEQIWTELMSLVSTEPSESIEKGWQRFDAEVLESKDPNRVKNQSAAHKFQAFLEESPIKSEPWLKCTILIVLEIDSANSS